MARQQLEREAAHRPPVRRHADTLPADHLRREVLRGAGHVGPRHTVRFAPLPSPLWGRGQSTDAKQRRGPHHLRRGGAAGQFGVDGLQLRTALAAAEVAQPQVPCKSMRETISATAPSA